MKALAPSGLGAKTLEPEPRLVSGSPSLPQGWQLKCWAPYDGDLSSPAHRTISRSFSWQFLHLYRGWSLKKKSLVLIKS